MRVWTTRLVMMYACTMVCVVCVLRVRTATVQQQSHSKFVWATSMRVLILHIYKEGLRMGAGTHAADRKIPGIH